MSKEMEKCDICGRELDREVSTHPDLAGFKFYCTECSGIALHDQYRDAWKDIRERRASEAMAALDRLINDMAFTPDGFIRELDCLHRTTQQSLFGLMMACIAHWGSLREPQYDGRNEWTVRKCREILKALDWRPGDRPPLV